MKTNVYIDGYNLFYGCLKHTIDIGIIIPVRKHSQRPVNARLSNHANWTRSYILDEELANNHLPNKIPTNKKAIIKPKYW